MNRPGTSNQLAKHKFILLVCAMTVLGATCWQLCSAVSFAHWRTRFLPGAQVQQTLSATSVQSPVTVSQHGIPADNDTPLKYGPLPVYWREGLTAFRAVHTIAEWDASTGHWVNLSPDLTEASQSSSEGFGVDGITSVAHRGGTWYAGTLIGRVKVMFGSTSWADVSRNLPDRTVSALAICPSDVDGRVAAAGFDGYATATPDHPGHVYVTFNHGQQWLDVTGDLPDAPVEALQFVNSSGRQALVAKVQGDWYAMSQTPMHWIHWTNPA